MSEKNIPPRVLIVDDEPDTDTDILLSDIKMPHLNGFELYSKIRGIDKEIRVCFITAFHIYYDEFRELFPKLDVRCFANKPISIEELNSSIVSCVNKRRTLFTQLSRTDS